MMMVEGEEGSSLVMDELFSLEDDDNEVFIDLDTFWKAMGGPPPDIHEGNRLDGSPFADDITGVQTSKAVPSTKDELPEFGVQYRPHTSETVDRSRYSGGFPESVGGSSILDCERLKSSTGIGEGNGRPYMHADGDSHNAASAHQHDKMYTENFMEERNFRTPTAQMQDSSAINGERTYLDSSYYESNASETSGADVLSENGDLYFWNSEEQPYVPYNSEVKSYAYDEGVMDEKKNHFRPFDDLVRSKVGQGTAKYENGHTLSLGNGVGINEYSGTPIMRSLPKKPSHNIFSNDHIKVKNRVESVTSDDIVSRASEAIGNVIGRKCYGPLGELSSSEEVKWPLSDPLSLFAGDNYVSHAKDEKEDLIESSSVTPFGMAGETSMQNSSLVAHDWHPVPKFPDHPGILPPHSVKAEVSYQKLEHEVPKFNDCKLSKVTYQGVQSNTLMQSDDDDSDLCILEDMSAPARPNRMTMNPKPVAAPQFTSRDPGNQIVPSHTRIKPNDEHVIFRVALQDLSQPKSEANPPDGVLAVPLLKHQRIALSWMVNKETQSACCSGGILADDQGLGKTISTIALILKERSPSSKAPKVDAIQSAEMLNLDEDDDGVLETSQTMEGAEPLQVNGCSANDCKTSLQAKGRPSGGTLIVCPTSVLRQWSEELHNKVTKEADLSVLVYHGSNRTKDPVELAKYDVVVTTYAIVSMEVPKQPVVNEDDDSIGSPFKEFSSCKKRKLLETKSDKNSSVRKKSKKGIDSELLDDISGPLAKVGWFRIVLDEAQSIKNHRTQVARACWGLRAKRRWCLSGTPIQNAIDDLYSYFRFLRHEPYAVFKTFCDQLKVPIHRNPKNGYKKLQLVLKTIMLRRTKGTLLDGEPIINLPPKTIELKTITFSAEEREFYCRLESESRAQFAEYAAAGTVKQNYVNILLMLLRLRQACDHPLLVKGFSNSKSSSSIEMAKKLSKEKQKFLLNCLEASLAICGICSDPPEDAVVTVCGHVFCNQCISEHALTDDTQCPTKKCRKHISMSCVFSIPILRNALSDQPSMENTTRCSGSEVSESRSLSCPQESSKIKAALDILLSLSKPQDCATRPSCSELSEGYCGSEKLRFCDSREDNKTSEMSSDMNGDSNNLVQVVGEKAIVFSQWTGMLDLLEDRLKSTPIQYRRLDGTMPVAARDRAVKDFNNLPQVSVMIMSLKAASLGLNMVAACNVLLLDLWWNPTTEDQAIDRAHRIGQIRPVSVYRLTVNDTVEDRILALQQRKRKMVSSAFGEDETGSRQTRLTVDDLKYLFRAD